jgi:hypothetical protein
MGALRPALSSSKRRSRLTVAGLQSNSLEHKIFDVLRAEHLRQTEGNKWQKKR